MTVATRFRDLLCMATVEIGLSIAESRSEISDKKKLQLIKLKYLSKTHIAGHISFKIINYKV